MNVQKQKKKANNNVARYHGGLATLLYTLFLLISIVYGGTFEQFVRIITNPALSFEFAMVCLGVALFIIAVWVNVVHALRLFTIDIKEHRNDLQQILEIHRIANEIRASTDKLTLDDLRKRLEERQVKMEPQEYPPVITKERKILRRILYEVPQRKHDTWAIFIPYLKYDPKFEFIVEDDQVLYGRSIDFIEPEMERSLTMRVKPIASVILFMIIVIFGLCLFEIIKLFLHYL